MKKIKRGVLTGLEVFSIIPIFLLFGLVFFIVSVSSASHHANNVAEIVENNVANSTSEANVTELLEKINIINPDFYCEDVGVTSHITNIIASISFYSTSIKCLPIIGDCYGIFGCIDYTIKVTPIAADICPANQARIGNGSACVDSPGNDYVEINGFWKKT